MTVSVPPPTTARSTTFPPTTRMATTTTTLPERWTAARSTGPLAVYDVPRAQTPVRTLEATTVLGTPTVVLVQEMRRDGWLRAALPGRPNGSEGWIRAGDVELFRIDRKVIVDLSDLTLEVVADQAVLLSTPVAIGKSASPTPLGVFFVTDAVRITRASGPWGPFALGLSARSEMITEFGGADGIIGIHGTSRPESIGTATSLGCVRVPNETMLALADLVGVGTPVFIEA